ncbi:MAG TPA: class I SAM-dependent methyltransferase, partial [Candidatus Polarisedimenticolia bacterium]|nr:class I SAM-dependent methyltransferase [Candidatus Polarisedimenticolia bacterium]
MANPIPCRLCGGETAPLFERTVLGAHRVTYHQCATCHLTQTDNPTWLAEAYTDAIHPTDTGILARNLGARRVVATFLHLSGVRREPCLDYAGGYGIFTRLMRDAGFEYFWMDPYAVNALARGFEWAPERGTPRVVTAFEVLEHLVRPLEEFRRIAELNPRWIITSTELH